MSYGKHGIPKPCRINLHIPKLDHSKPTQPR